jgi:hypothetical protein
LKSWIRGADINEGFIYAFSPYLFKSLVVLDIDGKIKEIIKFLNNETEEDIQGLRLIQKYNDDLIFIDFKNAQVKIYNIESSN